MFNILKFSKLPSLAKPMLAILGVVLFSTQPSAAQDFTPIITILETVTTALAGPLGQAIAAIAVAAIGFVFMMGNMDWKFAIAIVLGIGIVFGAAAIVAGVSGSTTTGTIDGATPTSGTIAD